MAKANANRKAAIKRPERPRPMANGGVTGPLNSAQIGASWELDLDKCNTDQGAEAVLRDR